MINIAIADDHALFTTGISAVINTAPGMALVKSFLNGQYLLDWYSGTNADVLLIDIYMPVLDGKKASKLLLERFPAVKIVILSVDNHCCPVNV